MRPLLLRFPKLEPCFHWNCRVCDAHFSSHIDARNHHTSAHHKHHVTQARLSLSPGDKQLTSAYRKVCQQCHKMMELDVAHPTKCRRPPPPVDHIHRRQCIMVPKGFSLVCRVCRRSLATCIGGRITVIDEMPRHSSVRCNGIFVQPTYGYICDACPNKTMLLGLLECQEHAKSFHAPIFPTIKDGHKATTIWIDSAALDYGLTEVGHEYLAKLQICNKSLHPCRLVNVCPIFPSTWSFVSIQYDTCQEILPGHSVSIHMIFKATCKGRHRRALLLSFKNSEVKEVVAWIVADAIDPGSYNKSGLFISQNSEPTLWSPQRAVVTGKNGEAGCGGTIHVPEAQIRVASPCSSPHFEAKSMIVEPYHPSRQSNAATPGCARANGEHRHIDSVGFLTDFVSDCNLCDLNDKGATSLIMHDLIDLWASQSDNHAFKPLERDLIDLYSD